MRAIFLYAFFIAIGFQSCFSTERTVAEWLELAKKGEKHLAGADFTGSDMRNMNLEQADLTGANLTGVNLSGANLAAANFYHANLMGTDFTGANLTKAIFLSANMQYANLRNAILKQALLQEANLNYAVLNGADLSFSNLLLSNFENADLQNADFSHAIVTYDSTEAPVSETTYSNDQPQAQTGGFETPEVAETEALSQALKQFDNDPHPLLKIKGAKINSSTKGIDLAWCRKNGAILIASSKTASNANAR
jgi:uncharacterized protein YjbI with pentapeptide repeats